MRPRALAITTLTAAILLTAIPADAMVAASPTEPSGGSGPTGTAGIRVAATELTGTIPVAPATGSQGHAGSAHVSTSGQAIHASIQKPAARVSAASVVVAYARSHLGARYQSSSTGPKSFDCSGLMWRTFKEAGLGTKVSSTSARSIYLWYRARGLASRHDPKVGDLVIWGGGSHVGLYIGGGNAISALTSGVRIHRVRAVLTPFTAYLRTRLGSLDLPAWELQVASHIRTLRHATRSVPLRTEASSASPSVGSLRSGTKFVVLASRKDGAGRLWLKALTFTGRSGWVPALASAR